jgi:hypothetical protein
MGARRARGPVMRARALHAEIAEKTADLDAIAERIAAEPRRLDALFEGSGAETARVKYGCLKLLRILGERHPAVLYPALGRVLALLDAENSFVKWGAILIVGELAAVDSRGRIDRILGRFLRPIRGSVMITAANTIRAAAKIARAKPQLADRIARAILGVEKATYQTTECRNVAIGQAVEAFDELFELLARPKPVVDFARRQLANSRRAVARKAARFLTKHGRDS